MTGVGLIYNPALAHLIKSCREVLDFVVISPEQFFHDRGALNKTSLPRYIAHEELLEIMIDAVGDLPLVAHGLRLSIGTEGDLDEGHLQQMLRWQEAFNFRWYSEHLSFSRLGAAFEYKELGIMLPVTYDEVTLKSLAKRVAEVSSALPVEFLLENAANYTPLEDCDYTECRFLNELCQRTDAKALLDLHNLYTNLRNQHGAGEDLEDRFIEAINEVGIKHIREIHIAGGADIDGIWTDSHSGFCPEEVWNALQYILSEPNHIRGVTYEIDPSCVRLIGEGEIIKLLQRVRQLVVTSSGRVSV